MCECEWVVVVDAFLDQYHDAKMMEEEGEEGSCLSVAWWEAQFTQGMEPLSRHATHSYACLFSYVFLSF
jgi:hypothetical protein